MQSWRYVWFGHATQINTELHHMQCVDMHHNNGHVITDIDSRYFTTINLATCELLLMIFMMMMMMMMMMGTVLLLREWRRCWLESLLLAFVASSVVVSLPCCCDLCAISDGTRLSNRGHSHCGRPLGSGCRYQCHAAGVW